MIFLDHAATSPVRREALEAMWPYLTGAFGNPSSQHRLGDEAARALAWARATVADATGARPGDVVFTSGGTEADNLALKGIALATPRGRHLVISPVEHEAVLESASYLERLHGFEVSLVAVDEHGLVHPDALARVLRDDTTLVSVQLANNEVGTVQPVAELAGLAHAAGARVHTDAVQAAGWLPLGLDDLGVDALSLAGHKVGAPKGTGALVARGRVPLEPVLHGGGQERGRRSGTENVAGAVAFATALQLAEAERAETSERVGVLRRELVARVLGEVPGARLTGDPESRLPGTASFVFPGAAGEAVLLELERDGVLSSSGSACAVGRDEPSHVLTAMGISPELAQTAVRFTLGRETSEDEVRAASDAVLRAVSAVRGIVAV
ncbi:cysteine desulfurase family protein [Agromyces aerolatus]|uniref:cysteine desulfurase family protein n=1 Tax=Agromyces sp. LY-1074 TaxID=3074080 RepID=UPI0028547533|nr:MULTISPECIES: cysteine desulfurase family protein [unclassified Agromyces]MDR5698888.1 cysteine desulfurase family protein [Agromyces sp. LY-1074]MDR5705334.1 cysteine desulfurase family protein [Agromyces sp. LY-1358]